MHNTIKTTESGLVRVPRITAFFWLVKILTTGAGETTSDYLGSVFSPAVVAIVGAVALAASLVLQFRMRRYVAWSYWLAVSMVAIVGTMFADVLHSLGISYIISASVFGVLLAVIFTWWYRSEGTLSIHSITNAKREGFYWATVITTFALGTAVGDMTATTFGWGYLTSGIVFTIVILLVALVQYLMRSSTNGVIAFWVAYILTRPLGASYADWMGEPRAKGGLEWGGARVSLILFAAIFLLVAYLAVTKKDAPEQPAERS